MMSDSSLDSDSSSDFDSDDDNDDVVMNETERDQQHEYWLERGRQHFQEKRQGFFHTSFLSLTRQLLMLVTLEPVLLELLRQTWNNLRPESTLTLDLDMARSSRDRHCRDPPGDEAILATTTELARMMSRSLSRLSLHLPIASMAAVFVTTCSRLEYLYIRSLRTYSLNAATVQSMSSMATLRQLDLRNVAFIDDESMTAFCHGLERGALTFLNLSFISYPRDFDEQLATTLARCSTLVQLDYSYGASQLLCRVYCAELANNWDTKHERLLLATVQRYQWLVLNVNGEHATVTPGFVDEAIVTQIRNLLKWNVQRTTCHPLFAALSNAETDARRQQCLVEALEAIDIPVVFEYLTTNQSNMIELIQRLGRER